MTQSEWASQHETYPQSPAQPEHIPRATVWPITLAFGGLFLLWGILTLPIVSGIGLILMGFAIAGWIRDISYERTRH